MSAPVTEPTAPDAATAPPAEPATPDTPDLGDAGKRAIDAMKAERNAAKQQAAELKAQLDDLRAKAEGREAEHAAQLAAQKVRDEALSAANQRILKAELRAASAGKLADPADALRFLDLSSFEVGDDGAVNASALSDAIQDLIKSKPYLAAATAPAFGSADAGVRNGAAPSIQAAIDAASKAGNHALAISLKRQQASQAHT